MGAHAQNVDLAKSFSCALTIFHVFKYIISFIHKDCRQLMSFLFNAFYSTKYNPYDYIGNTIMDRPSPWVHRDSSYPRSPEFIIYILI